VVHRLQGPHHPGRLRDPRRHGLGALLQLSALVGLEHGSRVRLECRNSRRRCAHRRTLLVVCQRRGRGRPPRSPPLSRPPTVTGNLVYKSSGAAHSPALLL
jgi:hypothetical protein